MRAGGQSQRAAAGTVLAAGGIRAGIGDVIRRAGVGIVVKTRGSRHVADELIADDGSKPAAGRVADDGPRRECRALGVVPNVRLPPLARLRNSEALAGTVRLPLTTVSEVPVPDVPVMSPRRI